jgi:hypothetical protein
MQTPLFKGRITAVCILQNAVLPVRDRIDLMLGRDRTRPVGGKLPVRHGRVEVGVVAVEPGDRPPVRIAASRRSMTLPVMVMSVLVIPMNWAGAVCRELTDRTATILRTGPGMVLTVVSNRRNPL